MESPKEILSINVREMKETSSVAEAASWLKHPVRIEHKVSTAQQLAEEPEWVGRSYDPGKGAGL